MSGASKLAEDATSSISEAVVGTPASEGKDTAESSKVTTEAPEAAAETETPTYETILTVGGNEIPEIIYDDHEAQEELEDIASEIHGSAHPSKKGAPQSVVSAASKKADNDASIASEAIIGTPSPVAESANSVVSDGNSKVSSAASKASNKVWGGASAGFVEARSIIYDDDSSFSEKMQSIIGEAGGRWADVTDAVSEALLKPSSTQGSAASVTSLAKDQYESAIAAASRALYGTEQGTGESITSVATERYSQAIAA
jgi:hypothetical protein